MAPKRGGSKGYSGLGLGHLGTLAEHHAAMHQRTVPTRTTGGRRASRKGASGETQVRDLWRHFGWPGAYRQPGSGNVRRYAGEGPVLPGDIAGVLPWLVEVKWDVRATRPARGGAWLGQAFVVATLRKLEQDHAGAAIIGKDTLVPVAFIRGNTTGVLGNLSAWRVFVPEPVLMSFHRNTVRDTRPSGTWVELMVLEFFATVGSPATTW